MRMAHARSPTSLPVTMLTLLFMTLSLLSGVSLGQLADSICFVSNLQCPAGYCCNSSYLCSNTLSSCGDNCVSQCTARCGPNYGGALCPDGECCSTFFYCGAGINWCGEGHCLSQCTNNSGSDHSNKSGGMKLGIGSIVGIATGIPAFLIVICIVIVLCLRRRYGGGGQLLRPKTFTESRPTIQVEGMPKRFSYKQLSVATRDFSQESKLGQGGFGSVYRGVLPSGVPVAVKKINRDSKQGKKEFMAEVSIISQLTHRNLIQLRGWCKDAARGQLLLVYELMPNGSLDKALFMPSVRERACLSWSQRFNIVTGTAAALDYLHKGWNQQVIHRDIKSSNIMLDGDWDAKLGDFGLARLVDHQREAARTGVAGTYGYIAPEAAFTGIFTDKTYVFAFGAVILEIACGRRASSIAFQPDEVVLVDWVWQQLSEGALLSTVDKRLEGNYDKYLMEVTLIIGLLCSHPNPEARPSMRHVVQVLAGDVPVPSIPTSKPASLFCSGPVDVLIPSLHIPNSRNPSESRSGLISTVKLSSTTKSVGASPNSNLSF